MDSTLNLTDSSVSINDPPGKKQEFSFVEKLLRIKKSVTVEPLLGCYIIPAVLSSMAMQNLSLELACRVNLGYDDETCANLISNTQKSGNFLFFFWFNLKVH